MNEQYKYIQQRMLGGATCGGMQLSDFSIKSRLLLVLMMLGIITTTKAQKGTPDPTKNYIQSIEVLNKDANKTIETINYFDGLGRSSQVITVQGSPLGKDVIVPIQYDKYGRQVRTYLPYVTNASNGMYHLDPVKTENTYSSSEHYNYYNNVAVKVAHSTVPYSEAKFEASPLNRVLKQGAPGEAWQVDGAHAQHFGYGTNATNDVLCFEVSGDRLVNSGGEADSDGFSFYKANSLYKNVVKDENWESEVVSGQLHTTEEFKDKQGQVVLKRSYVEENNQVVPVETYYVYDDFGLLRFVLPPGVVAAFKGSIPSTQSGETQVYSEDTQLASMPDGKKLLVAASGSCITLKPDFTFTASNTSSLTITTADFDESMMYSYKYDHKKRMIEKHLPGVAPVYMVYDVRDRLVLTQDGNQRSGDNDEWTYFKYDDFNRQKESGYVDLTDDFPDLLTKHDTIITNTFGTEQFLVKTFYDDYSWTGKENYNATHPNLDISHLPEAKGQVTGTIRSISGRNDNLVSTIYYDKQYRVVQTISDIMVNGVIGTEVASTQYWGFTSQPEKTITWQNISGVGEKYACEMMEYDDQGRLLKVKHGVGTTTPTTVLAEMKYNELGELIEKNLHGGIESIDYRYNIRGWLTSINNANLTNDGVKDDDAKNHFGMELSYDQAIQGANIDGEEQFNGNISGVVWKAHDEDKKAYGYAYDGLNRLKKADFEVYSSAWSDVSNFDVTGGAPKGIDYDIRGNIKSLKRYGNSSSYENDLVYTYSGNQLVSIKDNAKGINGSYSYDANGNMTKDGYRGFDVAYNRLNLPKKVSKGTDVIDYFYAADGTKVMKQTTKGGSTTKISYAGSFVYNGNQLDYILTSEGMWKSDGYQYNLKDHLGNVRVVINQGGAPVSKSDYYPFGKLHDRQSVDFVKNKYLYNGKEIQDEQLGGVLLDWYDYGARMYDAEIGRWHVVDPMIEKHHEYTGYAYTYNNPILYPDIMGLDTTIYVFDKPSRPSDNGTKGETYSAEIIVDIDGEPTESYSGSSYPNSKSNKDNTTAYNTVNEGEHSYDNKYGHKGSSKKGLNIYDDSKKRTAKGTDPNGNAVNMLGENVHSGSSDNGNYNSRGSKGCVTLDPNDVSDFLGNFDWSGSITRTKKDGSKKTYTGTTGNSSGKIIILRTNKHANVKYNELKAKQNGATYNPFTNTYQSSF
ncbi:hypothetical protein EYV94_21520 [Puteibacter caeruleilacunae]|nr:hypothetical protein EYV94_21520 [Puteibacter caeruleilacunae]